MDLTLKLIQEHLKFTCSTGKIIARDLKDLIIQTANLSLSISESLHDCCFYLFGFVFFGCLVLFASLFVFFSVIYSVLIEQTTKGVSYKGCIYFSVSVIFLSEYLQKHLLLQ